MLKWAATFIVNRLIFIAVVFLVLNTYTQNSCHRGLSLLDQVEQSLASLKEVARALQ